MRSDTVITNVYNPQGLNRYSFESNNPYNREDPSGHSVLLFMAAASFLAAADLYWLTTPIDENNPDMGNRLLKGLEHGAVAAAFTVLAAPLSVSSGVLRVAGPSLSLFGKGVVAGVGSEFWTSAIDNDKTTPQQVISSGAIGGLSTIFPGTAKSGQYAATNSFFSLQNYKMYIDSAVGGIFATGLVAGTNAAVNTVKEKSTAKNSGSSGGGYIDYFSNTDFSSSNSQKSSAGCYCTTDGRSVCP